MNNISASGSRVAKSILVLNIFVLLVPNVGWAQSKTVGLLDDVTATLVTTEAQTETLTLISTDTNTPELALTDLPVEFTLTLEPLAEADPPLSDQTLQGTFLSNEIIIRLRRNTSRASIEQCAQSMNGSIVSDIDELHAVVLSIPSNRVAQSLLEAESCPGLLYAEPNYLVSIADVIPSDPGWANQYGLTNIRAPQGWELDTGSSAITIAIIDSGIDLNHLDLASKLVGGIDLVNNDNVPQDDNGHGTHVAGIAAASSDNGIGVAGVSWGARLMPIKVLNAAGNGSYLDVADGIIWATDHGAQVINLSLGGGSPSQLLKDAVDYAVSKGVLLVAATGNSGSNFVLYPAHYDNVIAVGATDSSNIQAGFSNYGPEVDLAAPGVGIYSTSPGGYGLRNGTSMAAPHVSGLAAILLGIPGNTSPSAVRWQMQNTTLDLGVPGVDDRVGYGLIQMDAAIQAVGVIPTNTPTATATASETQSNTSASVPQQPGGFVQLPTLTPTSTPALSVTQTKTAAASATAINTDTAVMTADPSTPEVSALETSEIMEPTQPIRTWFLPCSGIFLILLGVVLFWIATQNRHRPLRSRSIRLSGNRYRL